uniref:Uncharacterized protein n=1 Tax=Hyaloperonospora arabidopsidis (strain Emoy2) TaxID=559515 RepID=M4BHX4_HYAAE
MGLNVITMARIYDIRCHNQVDNTLGCTFVGRVGSATKLASLLQNVVGRGYNVSDSSNCESKLRLSQHKIRNHCASRSSLQISALVMRHSALAGSFAALAGLLGKLGADSNSSALRFVETQCLTSSLSDSCALLSFTARLLCLALMLGANGLMLRCFVKGLHETDSLTATVTSAAVNFVLAAAGIALLLYGERSDARHKKTKRE